MVVGDIVPDDEKHNFSEEIKDINKKLETLITDSQKSEDKNEKLIKVFMTLPVAIKLQAALLLFGVIVTMFGAGYALKKLFKESVHYQQLLELTTKKNEQFQTNMEQFQTNMEQRYIIQSRNTELTLAMSKIDNQRTKLDIKEKDLREKENDLKVRDKGQKDLSESVSLLMNAKNDEVAKLTSQLKSLEKEVDKNNDRDQKIIEAAEKSLDEFQRNKDGLYLVRVARNNNTSLFQKTTYLTKKLIQDYTFTIIHSGTGGNSNITPSGEGNQVVRSYKEYVYKVEVPVLLQKKLVGFGISSKDEYNISEVILYDEKRDGESLRFKMKITLIHPHAVYKSGFTMNAELDMKLFGYYRPEEISIKQAKEN